MSLHFRKLGKDRSRRSSRASPGWGKGMQGAVLSAVTHSKQFRKQLAKNNRRAGPGGGSGTSTQTHRHTGTGSQMCSSIAENFKSETENPKTNHYPPENSQKSIPPPLELSVTYAYFVYWTAGGGGYGAEEEESQGRWKWEWEWERER